MSSAGGTVITGAVILREPLLCGVGVVQPHRIIACGAVNVADLYQDAPAPRRATRQPGYQEPATPRRSGGFFDAGPQRGQAVDEVLVAALDELDVVDLAASRGGQGGQGQRGARAQVGAVDRAALQLRRPGDDAAVRVAQHDAGAHRHELVDEEHAPLVHPVVHEGGAGGLRGQHDDGRGQVGGEAGPGVGCNLARAHEAADPDVHRPLDELYRDAHAREHQVDHLHRAGDDVADGNLSAGHGRRDGEGAHVDVVGDDVVLRAAQGVHALDPDDVAADALNA